MVARRYFLAWTALAGLVWGGTLATEGKFTAEDLTTSYAVGNARITVHSEEGALTVSDQNLMQWVHWASDSVTTYYGRFPVPTLDLRIIPAPGNGVRGGKTFGKEYGGSIRIRVGNSTTMLELVRDWMLTHEMVHLSFPPSPKITIGSKRA